MLGSHKYHSIHTGWRRSFKTLAREVYLGDKGQRLVGNCGGRDKPRQSVNVDLHVCGFFPHVCGRVSVGLACRHPGMIMVQGMNELGRHDEGMYCMVVAAYNREVRNQRRIFAEPEPDH